jgi:predicted secreted protein
LIDTRNCVKKCDDVYKAGAVIKLRAPAGASAVQINLTLVGAKAGGYATADKCSRIAVSAQAQSNINIKVGHIAANLAVVPVDADGTFCIYTSSATRVIVDVQGTFSPSGDLRFIPVSSVRRFDSRKVAN